MVDRRFLQKVGKRPSNTLMDCSSGDLASKDLIYNILTRETSMVSITLFGSSLRMNEKTASLISASISCSLDAPALITAARTCNMNKWYQKCHFICFSSICKTYSGLLFKHFLVQNMAKSSITSYKRNREEF